MKRSILQIHKYYWHRDGASNYMLLLSRLLADRGHTVIPFALKEKETLPNPYEQFFVSGQNLAHPERLSFSEKSIAAGRLFYSFEAKKKMHALLATTAVDIAHIHNIYHHISPSILPVLKKQGAKIVMTLHDYKLLSPNYSLFHHGAIHEEDARGWYMSCVKNKCMKDSRFQSMLGTAEMIWHHKIMKYYERFVDLFIAPSQCMMDLCIAHGWPKEKFIHIPNPLDMRVWDGEKRDGSSVVYAGRISPEKGVQILVQAARVTPDIPYHIIGTGPLKEELQDFVQKNHLKNVTFHGFQTGDRLHTLLEDARVVVVPSLWYENYPYSILEPKAMGKVVIGSHIGGIPELLPPALLVEPGNIQDLAERIRFWYTTPSKERINMGQTLRQEVLKTNDPEKHLERIEDVYEKMV